jgi:hypothetical protein
MKVCLEFVVLMIYIGLYMSTAGELTSAAVVRRGSP